MYCLKRDRLGFQSFKSSITIVLNLNLSYSLMFLEIVIITLVARFIALDDYFSKAAFYSLNNYENFCIQRHHSYQRYCIHGNKTFAGPRYD